MYIDTGGLNASEHEFLKIIRDVFLEGTVSPLNHISKEGLNIYQVGHQPTFIVDTNKNSKNAVSNIREVLYTYHRSISQMRRLMGVSTDYLLKEGYKITSLFVD